ncbi:MAG: TRAP transporter small permease subunit [Bacteroidota bacterium]
MLRGIIKIANAVNESIGRAVAWLTTLLVVLVCFDVARRGLFNTTAAWIMELEWHLFALVFLLGAGYTLKYDRHVRVDLFYAKFSKKDQAWVNLLGTLLLLIPWCLLLIYASYFYALSAYQIGECSPDPGGLPARYLIKSAITVGISLLLLQAFALAASSILILQNKTPEESVSENL